MPSLAEEESGGRRSQTIRELLLTDYTEFPDTTVVFKRVKAVKDEFERRFSRSTDASHALATVFLKSGQETLKVIRREYPRTVIFLPKRPSFQDVTPDDQDLIRWSLGAIAMAPAIDELTRAARYRHPWFGYARYMNDYNEGVIGTSLLDLRSLEIFKGKDANINDATMTEDIPLEEMQVLIRAYQDARTVNVGDPHLWIPQGLRNFWERLGVDGVIYETLAPTFMKRLAEVRAQEIPLFIRDAIGENDLEV